MTKYKPPKKPGLFTSDKVIEPSEAEWAKYKKALAKHAKQQQAHDEAHQRVMERLEAAVSLGKETASTEIEKILQD